MLSSYRFLDCSAPCAGRKAPRATRAGRALWIALFAALPIAGVGCGSSGNARAPLDGGTVDAPAEAASGDAGNTTDASDASSTSDASDSGNAADASDAGNASDANDSGSAVDASDAGNASDASDSGSAVDASDAGNVDAGSTTYNDMTQSSNWAKYDTGTVTVNFGGTFDGRYVYFAPDQTGGVGYDGLVTRYDTQAPFGTAGSWTTFNTSTVNANARGFWGAAFDGRYVYLVPQFNGVTHGTVTRYDTQAAFGSASSWSTFDTSTVSANAKGFMGATFDGRYLYFVPHGYSNTVNTLDGLVARYDTQAAFASAGSWSTFDTASVDSGAVGFTGGVFDGRYLYLVPDETPSGLGSTVARYDTQAAFTSAGSWSTFDTTSVDANAAYFHGGAFDGRYVYFVPGQTNGGGAGLVTRYDTQGTFGSAASWSTFSTTTLSPDAKGFWDATFDGRYIYFVPYQSSTSLVTRYDTQGAFGSAASWSTFSATSLDSQAKQLGATVFDGRYVYFLPGGGRVVTRFDSKSPPSMPNLPGFFGSFL